MPNRIIKESICISETIDSLTWMEEVFFYRLIVNCDDYGRLDARPAILKAKLFPLKDITQKQISETLNKLTMAGMVMVYEYDQRPYLQLVSWSKHQQIRNKKSKYPSPDEGCNQLISDESKCPRNPIQSESNLNPNPNPNPTPAAADENVKQVYKLFKDCGMGEVNSIIAETMQNIADEYPMDLVKEAFRLTGLANVKTINYPDTILKNWKAKGITTIEGAKKEQEDRSKKADNGLNKKLDFGKFPQHEYKEGDLDYLFENIEKTGGETC